MLRGCCENRGLAQSIYALRFTFHVSRFTFYALRFTFHVSRFTFHVLRFTLYVLRFTLYVLCYVRLTDHALRCAGSSPWTGSAAATTHAEGAFPAGELDRAP